MKYMKNWGCKIKYNLKYLFRNRFKNVEIFMAFLGSLLVIAEATHYMWETDVVYNFMRNHSILVIIVGLLWTGAKGWKKFKIECFLKNADDKIQLRVMDVLNADAAIVIPTNTTFDTKMEDEFISVNSVQGQFQEKFFRNNLNELDRLLEDGLKENDYIQLDRKNSKNKQYPLGTVSGVTYMGKHYYFVAIADINEHGKTVNTKFENIQIALEGLWNHLGNKGHIENLAMPILGTGKAGIRGASRNRVIKEIIFSFVASANERKIAENLLICVHPRDLEYKDLDLEDLEQYLNYMCKYRYASTNKEREGTEIGY